jgi:TIR domain
MTGQRLFISHASEDSAVADHIVAYLETRGVACWISSRDIPPRAIYADAIVEAMQSCTACAVLVSAASNASKAVKREVELASHEDKDFIPIGIDGSDPASGLAYYLRNVQWVEYRKSGNAALDKIVGRANAAPRPIQPARQGIEPSSSSILTLERDMQLSVGGSTLAVMWDGEHIGKIRVGQKARVSIPDRPGSLNFAMNLNTETPAISDVIKIGHDHGDVTVRIKFDANLYGYPKISYWLNGRPGEKKLDWTLRCR